MGNRKRKAPIIINNIEIIDTASKGKAIAKHEGRVIFVEGGVPGDICDIQLVKRKKKYWQAQIIKTHTHSKIRTEPKCEHFGVCGGCKWQNMKYKSQLDFKQNEVINNLRKIGGIKIQKNPKIIASKNKYFYRNKMEFTFSNKRWLTLQEIKSKVKINDKEALGFHIPGMFDKVINIKKCHLQKDPSNEIRLAVEQFSKEHNLTYFDIRNQTGLLRNLMIRNTSTNELMVLVHKLFS